MRKRLVFLGLTATVAIAAMVWLVPVTLAYHEDGKVTVCHRTGSAGNPFVTITTDNSGTLAAHLGNYDAAHAAFGPPHPPKNGNPDFFLPFPGGTEEQCKDADPNPPK